VAFSRIPVETSHVCMVSRGLFGEVMMHADCLAASPQ
jgi:hypothetical protein